jgi:ParB family transcriptional regulator, chromosome partitioning protein
MRPIEMIPVKSIQILNPRARNQRQYREIVENIDRIGLKRPITVSRKDNPEDGYEYDLVCGQGRLEAFQCLGHTEVPAVVISAKQEDCLVMSLVENIARRQHPAIELMREIESLHKRGYNETEIAQKLGVTASWVSMLLNLLENGEERLVSAVETGLIPISLAVTIARSDDAGVQQALADAYTEGIVKGKKLAVLRRLLDQRARRGKGERHSSYGPRNSRKLSSENLRRIYQREVGKQQLLLRKADFTQKRLLFVIQAIQTLLSVPEFISLLREEHLETIPGPLERRMARGAML